MPPTTLLSTMLGEDPGAQLRVMLSDQFGGGDARVVVVLGDDRGKAGGRQFAHKLEVIDATRSDRRAAVHVRIDRAFEDGVDAGFVLVGHCMFSERS